MWSTQPIHQSDKILVPYSPPSVGFFRLAPITYMLRIIYY